MREEEEEEITVGVGNGDEVSDCVVVFTWSKTSVIAACAGGARKRKKVGELQYFLRHCCDVVGRVDDDDDEGSGKEDGVDVVVVAVVTC